ncbi:MAG: HAD family hydrolase [Trueperaceae bacterium]|nr:MAG: HAD family hydrolase [Trueperaceae bacterium]
MPLNSETIVFDLDGTLVDSLPDIVLSFQEAFRQQGVEPPEAALVRPLLGKPLEEMFSVFVPHELVTDLVAGYRSHYSQHCTDHSRPFPGVPELLTVLRDRGYKLVVATTKRSATARTFVAALGLDHYLDHIQGTDDFPHKPAPDVIFRALRSVQGEGLWMVGDSASDIVAGKAAGLRTYAVTWGGQDGSTLREAGPDRLEPSLESLLEVLD